MRTSQKWTSPLRFTLPGFLLALGIWGCSSPQGQNPTGLLAPMGPSTPTVTPALRDAAPPTVIIPPTDTPTPTLLPTFTPSPSPTVTVAFPHVFPVRPLRWVSYKEGHAGYPATDIFAPEGYEFLAVTGGVVDFACPEDLWDPETDDPATRGGISVAIIGDDGVRYYGSHLQDLAEGIRPGARIEAGQVLGHIGKTGNARDTLSHVHFAISAPTYPEDWKTRRGQVEPYPYLQAWQEGENITPNLP